MCHQRDAGAAKAKGQELVESFTPHSKNECNQMEEMLQKLQERLSTDNADKRIQKFSTEAQQVMSFAYFLETSKIIYKLNFTKQKLAVEESI